MVNIIKNNKLVLALSFLVVIVASMLLLLLSPRHSVPMGQGSPIPTQVPGRAPAPTILPVHELPADLDTKPWTLELPLYNPNYYVEYDAASNTIRAYISTAYSRTVPREDQAEFIKQRVQERLKGLGVNLSKENIEWIIEEN